MDQPTVINATVLAESTRNGLVENRHWGWLAVCTDEGTPLYSTPGSDEAMIFLRSSAKPFQSMPLVQSGLHQELSQEELALTSASHVASPYHTALAHSILQKAGLREQALGCGPHPPIHRETANAMIVGSEEPTAIHNNCSGKHAGMLLYCVRHHLPTENYLDPEHPLQQLIEGYIQTDAGLDSPPQKGVDGCGTPTYYMPLMAGARLYANLGQKEAYRPIVQAMAAYPEVVGGKGRVDTAIMKASAGKLIAKIGADGVIGVSRVGKNQGLMMKIADGSTSVRNRVVVSTLEKLSWLSTEGLRHDSLKPFLDRTLPNTQKRTVGHLQICLPEYDGE